MSANDKALLVGINEYPDNQLRGCVNDIVDMADFLVDHCKFSQSRVRLLVDARATKRAIVQRLGWLLNGARKGDRLLFHYSGHGTQLATRNPQGEVDQKDEAIVPIDYDWDDEDSFLRDKEFNEIFAAVPDGVEFIWVSDSCHSGDLSRDFRPLPPTIVGPFDTRLRFLLPPADIRWRLDDATNEKSLKAVSITKSTHQNHVALISGCKSNQTSADATFEGKFNGALTYFLLRELKDHPSLSLTQLVKKVRHNLGVSGFSQEPQLEGDKTIMEHSFFGRKAAPGKKRRRKKKKQ